jgi:hypothetical protein
MEKRLVRQLDEGKLWLWSVTLVTYLHLSRNALSSSGMMSEFL